MGSEWERKTHVEALEKPQTPKPNILLNVWI